MKKQIVRYCWNCNRETTHNLVEVDRCFEGFSRIFLGIISLGASEVNNIMNKKYECSKCGKFIDI